MKYNNKIVKIFFCKNYAKKIYPQNRYFKLITQCTYPVLYNDVKLHTFL